MGILMSFRCPNSCLFHNFAMVCSGSIIDLMTKMQKLPHVYTFEYKYNNFAFS